MNHTSLDTPLFCVDNETLLSYAVMAAAIALVLGIVILVLCLICRQKARRDRYYTERLKAQLQAQDTLKLEKTDDEDEEEEEVVTGLELVSSSIPFQQTSDYSTLHDAV